MVGDRVQVLRKAKAENTYKVNSTINTRHLRSHTVKASRTLLVSLEGPGLPGGCTRLPDVGHVQTVTTDGSHGPRQHPDGLLHRDLLGAETQNSSWELGLRGLSPPSAPPPPPCSHCHSHPGGQGAASPRERRKNRRRPGERPRQQPPAMLAGAELGTCAGAGAAPCRAGPSPRAAPPGLFQDAWWPAPPRLRL